MNKVLLFLIFTTTLTSCILPCNSKNILVFLPISSRSVKNVYLPLIKELASKGHNITVVSAASSPPIENVEDIVFVPGEKVLERLATPFDLLRLPIRIRLAALNPDLMQICTEIYEQEDFKKLAKDPKGKFDLVILNAVGNYCFYGLIHEFQAPVIGVMSFPPPNFVTEPYGLHLPYSFVPVTFLGYTDKMTFCQRVQNFILQWLIRCRKYFQHKPESDKFIASKHGPNIPSIEEIEGTFSLLLSNTHFAMNSKLPLTPDIIEVGGMHCRPSKRIEEGNLQKWLDDSTNGFIYFSFGSVIQGSQIPKEYKIMFTQVFSNLSVNVLWKWESDFAEFIGEIPPNVRLEKWVSQQDVLGHKNIKLFISHGGILGVQEAVYHAVPILGFPFFLDQGQNMAYVKQNGIGENFEILEMTEEKLSEVINQMITNDSYKTQIQEMSRVFRDQPQTPLERALFWVEFVLRHDGAYFLKSASRDLSLFKYQSYDVVLFLVVASLILLIFFYGLYKYFWIAFLIVLGILAVILGIAWQMEYI